MKRLAVAALALLGGVLFSPAVAGAHAALDYTLPADGATVGEPLDEIRVAFTEPVTLVGNGFEVLDPQGQVVLPTPITDDDIVFRLIFDEPLAGGDVGVIYEVTSADGHVISGGFSFAVDAPVPTTTTTSTPTAPTSTGPPTTAPGTTSAAATTTTTTTTPAIVPSETTEDTPPTTPATAPTSEGDTDEGGSTGLIIAIALAVVIAGAAFVLFRARSSE